MSLNKDIAKGKWLEIKGEVQKTWGKLTDDELEQTKGDAKAIAGLVQQKYGEKREKFHDRYAKLLKNLENKKDSVVEDVKNKLR
ncbi:MAG: CsbD family protein [Bdellovibrionales bacterium CG10_big_fil_rev_8_21_14_0_10_45_34]|nr:MAG: CsbD family protein [Bdellovibrionales bacterium CG10_big_fil_rev_8_21_14_0_10_45_34]